MVSDGSEHRAAERDVTETGPRGADAPDGPSARAYLIAVATAMLALGVRIAIDPLVGTRHRFALLYAAAMVIGARYGLRPALSLVAVGALGMAWLAASEVASLRLAASSFLDLTVYALTAGGIAWVAAAMRDAKRRADTVAAALTARTDALRHSDERYRSFIRQSSEGIWRCELDEPVSIALSEDEQVAAFYRTAYFAECNEAMARMYGFDSPQELAGLRLGALLPPDDPANQEYLRAFIRSEYRLTDAESHELDRDGRPKYFLNNLIGVIEGGSLIRAWGTQRDVTDRRAAEEEMRASERRLKVAVAAARMGIWDWDLRDGALTWSDRTRDIVGFPDGMLRGGYEDFLRVLHPDDAERVVAVVTRARTEGIGEGTVFRLRRPDGALRWVLVYGRVTRAADGAVERISGVVLDVTREKEAELEVQQLLVREREARAEAERSNRAKDEFLATLSHELRSPLSAALSWTQMLRRGLLDPEKTARALDTIERNTRLQVRLIEDLLDISRIVSGKLALEIGVVDLRTILEAAVEAAHGAAQAAGVRLEVREATEVLLVSGDATRLEQIVGNLLANAVKFTPVGGHVAVELTRVDGVARITVTDTGIGIAPDVLPHVFDRFRQADSTTTRRYGGLGLGLAIVRHLVELHGGTIEAESAGEGRGTVMRVTLPLEATMELGRTPGPRAAAQVGALPRIDGVRVLVVDDEDDIREFLVTVVSAAGASVSGAGSVVDAMARLATTPVDVVISDLAMPERDGYALLAAIRGSRHADVPVVALTALASAPDRRRALAAGFDIHLTKPVDPVALIVAIARVARPPAADRRTAS